MMRWDNLVFLMRWFHKFPQYIKSNLFITGESYADHYVPQLAKLMIEFNKKKPLFNLKGVALGNPILEFATDFNSRAEYFWSHGLISDSTYRLFSEVCNYSRYVSEYYRDSVSPACSKVMRLVSKETSKFVDKYDVTLDVCISSVLSQSKRISPQENVEKIDVCVEDETVNYLNRKDVQKALGARLVGVRSCIKVKEKRAELRILKMNFARRATDFLNQYVHDWTQNNAGYQHYILPLKVGATPKFSQRTQLVTENYQVV